MNGAAHPVQRRHLVLAATVAPLLAACQGAPRVAGGPQALRLRTIDDARTALLRAIDERRQPPPGGWGAAQVMTHLAQSIELSMTGYPQPRSRLFQATLGAAAFGVFEARGRMSHGLDEPIPGAAPLGAATDTVAAQARLLAAIDGFQRWPAPLLPHFAYGSLSRPQYELAHAMHVADHLSAWVVAA